MKYLTGLYTDIGIKKRTNQDSMLLLQASTAFGDVTFAVVCDGMGGLQKGEVASAELIRACSDWFKQSLPQIIQGGTVDTNRLHHDWEQILKTADERISSYGSRNGFNLGTTMVCILLFGDKYYVANIGDSRAYMLSDQIYQITHDHTVVQMEIDRGNLTLEQSLRDPRRSVLLQCIGASDYVQPDFFAGNVVPNQCFLLCCDGFRHVIAPRELYAALNPQQITSEAAIPEKLKTLTEEIKARGETDNISAILIRTCQ